MPALSTTKDAVSSNVPILHEDHPDNVLIEGSVEKGDVTQCGEIVVRGEFETRFVEHAYIEPEAGWAQRIGDRIEMHVTTQAVHMDRDEIASVMRLEKELVRVIPSACGGGFGGKLDVSVQPLLAIAAYRNDRPVAMVYERPESMIASTKRHPSRIWTEFSADRQGYLQTAQMQADFNTGAYASWGPTVAGRVPVHGSGPYFVPSVKITGRGIYTNGPPAGAFRGFGVPQAAIAHECMMDDLAEELKMDRLEIRLKNAIREGQETATGQELKASAGLAECLQMLQPHWRRLMAEVDQFNQAQNGRLRRGIGIGAMWYGIGNTALSNPSTMEVGINRKGQLTLFNGAVDIGQGSNTVLLQICADAAGLPVADFHYVMGDSDLTEDAGKTSASRQTFVSGKAAELAGLELRRKILRHVNAGEDARLSMQDRSLVVEDQTSCHEIQLETLTPDEKGQVFVGRGRFDPPTTMLDKNGQGIPYATYGFAAQIALVEVDMELATTRVLEIFAAHDVGRAINPQQVEGQIQGGIAQGLGLALMEEYVPGKTENLHDYLIPTVGDMPDMTVIIVEDAEPLGPYGAKGVGEPGLVPTAPAIFSAIRHASGVRVTEAPMLPHRLKAALQKQEVTR
ncbi:xanthine dehydrogenase family protein molybdopterin-binding subunit [Sneathiella glossodoripedis]|uniref:xanthine dehydrogenase family protein molybdopterin-binding subunit n=1 Tax=Sneathiella glossodoripedis TaxID=418853 RepID=UPI000AA9ECE7|nr:molybdopterin cofactor-binding domain-containing protein [Sneathiella glossodoripedis]